MNINFKQFNRQSAKSYNQQKALIKKLLQGREQLCVHCQQPIVVNPTEHGFQLCCNKKCTDIELEGSALG